MKKKILPIKGMHCASCSVTIEKALKKVDGVSKASVNYANEKAFVEYDESKSDEKKLAEAVRKAGYDVYEGKSNVENKNDGQGFVRLSVEGMMSHHCDLIVEGSVKKLPGIKEVKADFSRGMAEVAFDPGAASVNDIINAIDRAGYKAKIAGSGDYEKIARENEIKSLKAKFIVSFAFGLPLLYLAMAHWFSLPLPMWDALTMGIVQLALVTPIIVCTFCSLCADDCGLMFIC